VAVAANGFDLVLRGGRVVDPESGLDAVRDVAVADGRIAAVGTGLTARAPRGDVDVAGQVVTAGFIDLHSHVSDLGGLRLQAMDGVTTALELEAGVTPVAQAYDRAAGQGRPINYGFAASWALARMEAVAGLPADASLGAFMARISDPAWQRPAEPGQVGTLLDRLAADLAEGALGIGVLLGYAPAATPIPPRSPIGPATGTAPCRRPGSGTCWSTMRSWCGMARSCPTRGLAGRSAPSLAERARAARPARVPGSTVRTQLSCTNKPFPL